MKIIKVVISISVLLYSVAVAFGSESGGKSVEEIIPLTAANLRGHKMLYDEGYSVIVSSRKAFGYAKEKSIISSREALQQVMEESSRHSGDFKEDVKADVGDSVKDVKEIVTTGTKRTWRILKGTHSLAKAELAYAGEGFQDAWGAFVTGNINIGRRTEAERKELAALPGGYFRNLKSDFSNLWDITSDIHNRFAGRIDASWDKAFQKASREFKDEYNRSGEESNSLTALGHILSGYLKAFYHGVAAPSSKTIVKAGSAGTSGAVFLPVAATAVVTGRTVQSAGLTLYYVGKTGVKVISPTVEGGLLTSMSLLSLGAVPVTYISGTTIGAVNQVAFTAGGPVYGATEAAVATTADTAKYVGFLAYDGVKGTTKVVINQAQSGVVLGYHAMTAIPAHLLMGAVDGAVFLAYDGPRLVIAMAKGEVKSGKGQSYPVGDLPVGTAVDLKKLETVDSVKISVISDDPSVIRDVIQKLPSDLREEGAGYE